MNALKSVARTQRVKVQVVGAVRENDVIFVF